MLRQLVIVAIVVAACGFAAGCGTLFEAHPLPNSLVAQIAPQATNQINAVAYIQALQALNTAANPTPTEPIINTGLGGLIVLAGSFATYWQHRRKIAK